MQMAQFNHLPPRNGHASNKLKLTTNLYEVRLDKLKATLFYYRIQHPQLQPHDCLFIIKEQQNIHLLYQRIGYICDFKEGVLGNKRVDDCIQIADQSIPNTVISLQLSKPLQLQQLMGETCSQKVIKRLIGPMVNKSVQNSEKSIRNDFIGKHKIVVTPNFHFGIVEMKKKLFLSTNITLQIREDCTLLAYIQKYNDHQSIKTLLVGKTVVASYGKRKIYTISGVDFTKTVESKERFSGKEMSYCQFYKEKYSLTISNTKQPMLVAKGSRNASIYLVPQLLSLYNAISPNEMNQDIKKKISMKKWQLPQQKEVLAVRVIKDLGESEVIKKSAHNFDGIQLRHPTIAIDKGSVMPQDGLFNFRGRILRPVEIRNWGIVYLQSKDKEADNHQLSRLQVYLRTVSPQYGIKITNQAGFIPVPSADLPEWGKAVSKDIERYGVPQFLIYFLREEEASLYSGIKKSTMVHKFPSQVIMRKTFEGSNKKPYAIAADIILQIQAKLGATLWDVVGGSQLLKKRIMVGAFRLSSYKQGLNFSFVGGINPQGSQVYSNFKKGVKYNQINLEVVLMYWARNYVSNNKFAPDTIVIYREEGHEYSQRTLIEKELEEIKGAIKKIGEKIKTSNYNPSISYILVSTTHEVEIYSRSENEHRDFIVQNPSPGTVVIEKQQGESTYEFYLHPSRSFTRTEKPTRFTVLEGSQLSAENLIGLTYEECYNYYNVKGAVRVPACLEYARKLGRFSEKTEVQLGYEERLSRSLYFI